MTLGNMRELGVQRLLNGRRYVLRAGGSERRTRQRRGTGGY
jgi:hypothetical protein